MKNLKNGSQLKKTAHNMKKVKKRKYETRKIRTKRFEKSAIPYIHTIHDKFIK